MAKSSLSKSKILSLRPSKANKGNNSEKMLVSERMARLRSPNASPHSQIAIGLAELNYASLFRNEFLGSYFPALQMSMVMSGSLDEFGETAAELETLKGAYGMLVYYFYPLKPDFQKKINGDKELSRNFKMVKRWLDRSDGKQAADQSFRSVIPAILK